VVDSIERGAMVGRDGELARLESALDAAKAGNGRTIVLGGEAGIGKSRLVGVVAERAAQRGTTVLSGDCLPTGPGTTPYAPFVEAFRGLIRATDAGAVAGLLGTARSEIGRLLPEVAASAGPIEAIDDRSGQGRLFEALLGVIERRAKSGPVLLIVEDAQWADEGTRSLVTFLSRNLRHAPVLILLTVRSEDLSDRGPVAQWLGELERDAWVERIELTPLGRPDLTAMLQSLSGSMPSSEFIDSIAERTAGNPFFVEQLAAVSTSNDAAGLPPLLRDVLVARLSDLPEATRIVLRAAAAAGRRVDDEVLGVVLGLSPTAISDALRPAISHGILVDAADASGGRAGYEFHHSLLAEVAENELLHGERERLHAAFALELERRGEVDGVVVSPAELAYHWLAAHDRERALPALVAAGLEAERVYAFAEARRYLERALSLWPDDPSAAAATGLDRVAVLQRAAESAVLSGAYADAVAFGRQAIVAAELDDVIGGRPDPARLGALHERLRWYLWEAGDRAAAEAVVAEAVRLIPADPPTVLRARALGQAAGLRLFGASPLEAGKLATEAIAVARSAGAPSEEALALGILGWAIAVGGDVDRGIATYREGLAIAERLGGVEGIALGHANLAALLDRVGRTAASLEAAKEGYAIAERFGVTRTYGGELLGHVSKASFDLGRWDEAEVAADAGLALDPIGPSAIWLHINRARVDTNRGRFAEAERHLREAGEIAIGAGRYRAQLLAASAELAAWQRRPHAVRAAVEDVLANLDANGPLDPSIGWLAWHALRAEADAASEARSRRDDTTLAEIERRVVPIVDQVVRSAKHAASRPDDPRRGAVAGLCTGELGRLQGADDPNVWDEAATAWDALERPAPAAYARFRSAEAAIGGRGDRAPAAANLRTAHATAIRLGAVPIRDEIERLARHARIDLEIATRPDSPKHELGLTEREAEVMRLVAAGRSNQQIADTLFITRKTASVHVSNIIGKLGVANRVEAAAIAQRLGLVDDPVH
jgi:DNA-binding CsgD family transcriptional regulator/tetratricopeptide (TPR) repeat protein